MPVFSRLIQKRDELYSRYDYSYYAVVVVVIYVLWKGVKSLIKSFAAGDYYADMANDYFGLFYAKVITFFLAAVGVAHRTGFATYGNNEPGTFPFIALDGDAGIAIAYHCLGITVLVLYNIVFFFLPGKTTDKLKYMLMGSATIVFFNVIRIAAILFSSKYLGSFYTFLNHSVLFVVLTYAILAMYHYFFMKKNKNTATVHSPE